MRFLWRVFLLVTVLAAGVGGYVIYNATSMVEDRMTETLRTPVSISRVQLWWGSVGVHGMNIQNIAGSEMQSAFQVSSIDIKADPRLIMSEGAHLQEIVITNPTLSVELFDQNGQDTNWSRMLAHLKGSEQGSGGQKQEFKLDHLLVTNIVVRAKGGPIGAKAVEVTIPKIEEFNLTSDSQLPIRAIVEAITDAVIQRAIAEALPQLVNRAQELLKNPTEVLKAPGEILKNSTEGTKGLLDKVIPGQSPSTPSTPGTPSAPTEEKKGIIRSLFD